MASLTPLSIGCLADIMAGVEIEKPILQILGNKRIASTEGSERYRVLLSDGKHSHSFAMLGTQLNHLILDGAIADNSIVRIDKYITSTVNKSDKADKKVMIILALDILHKGDEIGRKIGSPAPITDNPVASTPAASSASSSFNPPSASTLPPISRKPQTSSSASATMNTSMTGSNLASQLTHPIVSLSPYQNKWVIKARVTSKTNVRTWKNAKGEGKLFSMDLMDESGEIRVTAFREQCDKFFDMIEVDKVYYISKGQLKPANKQFTTIKNDYEMTLGSETVIQECQDDVDDTPKIQYNLVPIAQIANTEPNTLIDVLGVCKNTGELMEFTAKTTGRELKKREVTLVDNSNASVDLTLWGDDAEKFDGYTQPVILVKGARVTEFSGGKTISLIGGSAMKTNPDIPEGHRLRGWFDNGGSDKVAASVSSRTGGGAAGSGLAADWMSFHEAKLRNLGGGDKPDYFQCRATINLVRTTANMFYKACAQPDCNKKVVDDGNGFYMCEKCKVEMQSFKYRLILNLSISDWSTNRWVTCFSDLAEKMLNKTAQELGELHETDVEECSKIMESINFKSYIFKLRTKAETFADSLRTKTTAMAANPINYEEYNNYLIKNIQNLTGIGSAE